MKKLSFVLLGITAAALSAFDYNLKEDGLKLPPGFSAQVFAKDVGIARHLAITPQGNVYVKLSKLNKGSGIVLLHDLNKNGKTEKRSSFGKYTGTGMVIGGNYLYASSDEEIFRYALNANGIADTTHPERIVTGSINRRQHASKSIAVLLRARMVRSMCLMT